MQTEVAIPEPPPEAPHQEAPEAPTTESEDFGASAAAEPAIAEPAPAPPVQDQAQPGEAVASVGAPVADVATVEPTATKPAAKTAKRTRAKKAAKTTEGPWPRDGSKTAQVVEMLKREGGATISEIMSTMGWQKHTVRGFMAGTMKKAGHTVESFKPEGGERTYRIDK